LRAGGRGKISLSRRKKEFRQKGNRKERRTDPPSSQQRVQKTRTYHSLPLNGKKGSRPRPDKKKQGIINEGPNPNDGRRERGKESSLFISGGNFSPVTPADVTRAERLSQKERGSITFTFLSVCKGKKVSKFLPRQKSNFEGGVGERGKGHLVPRELACWSFVVLAGEKKKSI